MQGDISVLPEFLSPSHFGGRAQVEISLDIVIGLSGTAGLNVVYNRISDELVLYIDWSVEPGIGIGGGASGTGGLLVGWGSSSVDDVSQGYSGIVSATLAAEAAVTAAASVPIDENGLYVDPYYGQIPVTLYIGGGGDGGYASIGGGINGQTGLYADLTPLLPWRWNK
jgi:hypothetical protein